MLNFSPSNATPYILHSSGNHVVSIPKSKKASKITVINPANIIKACEAKIESIVPTVLLALALFSIPIGGYFLHIMNMPETLFFSGLIVTALIALKIQKNSMEDREKKGARAKNLPLFKDIVNGVKKIETIPTKDLLECLTLAPSTDAEFFAECRLPNLNYQFQESYAFQANKIIHYVEDKPNDAKSSISHLGFEEPLKGRIGFINGILNNYACAYQSALLISHLSGGANVHLVHNASHGLVNDLIECRKGLNGILTEPVLCLHTMWDEFFRDNPQDEGAKFFQICHSQGAIHVRNALSCYPEALRKRIQVIAIAPGAYIPEDISPDAYHYISWDPVPKVDDKGQKKAARVFYCKTPNWENHLFTSKIYLGEMKRHIEEFLIIKN